MSSYSSQKSVHMWEESLEPLHLRTCFQGRDGAQLVEYLLCTKLWGQSPNTTSHQAWSNMQPQHLEGGGEMLRTCFQPGIVAPTSIPSLGKTEDREFKPDQTSEICCSCFPTLRYLKTQQRNTTSFPRSGLLAERSPK